MSSQRHTTAHFQTRRSTSVGTMQVRFALMAMELMVLAEKEFLTECLPHQKRMDLEPKSGLMDWELVRLRIGEELLSQKEIVDMTMIE